VSGIVGAGGNVGAVCFGLGFRQLETKAAFILMGSVIIFSGITCAMVFIKGHAGLVTGHDSEEVIAAWKKLGVAGGTLTVPEQDAEDIKAVDKDTGKNSEAELDQFTEYVSDKNIKTGQ
jgi:NNP family nitrate/nitrite transporter-like MFS transporter